MAEEPWTLWVESMVAGRDGEPYVVLKWPKDKTGAQLTPDEARQHALRILEAADAAEGDAFLMQFLSDIGSTPEAQAGAIKAFREWRAKRGRTTHPTPGRKA